jgi:FkbM family methyltransferase
MDYTGPGSFDVLGFRVDYWNQSHALFLLHEIFVNAEYEFRSSAPRPRIVDCGANIGMAILFFKALCPAADVLAFEPDPVTFSRLAHTIESNGLSAVVAERAAVTEEGGTIRLYRNQSDPGSIVASIDQAWGGDAAEEVPAVRLSERITTTVDFLKLDVEGAEYGVVRDLVSSGAIRWVREAVIEYHQAADKPRALDEMTSALRGAGFELTIEPSRGLLPTGLIHARRAD